MSTTGQNEQPRATVTSAAADEAAGTLGDGLDWQSELDSAMTELDSRLLHPRRRTNAEGRPELTSVHITNELLDEIAWRVSQRIRRDQPATVASTGVAPAAVASDDTAQAPMLESPRPQSAGGIALTIRVRRPLFRWRFWRRSRRRQAMMLFSDFRVS
jgi:hypothetical protein